MMSEDLYDRKILRTTMAGGRFGMMLRDCRNVLILNLRLKLYPRPAIRI